MSCFDKISDLLYLWSH